MIVFNGFKLVGISIMIILLVICIIINVIDRLICAAKKHKQSKKRRIK